MGGSQKLLDVSLVHGVEVLDRGVGLAPQDEVIGDGGGAVGGEQGGGCHKFPCQPACARYLQKMGGDRGQIPSQMRKN